MFMLAHWLFLERSSPRRFAPVQDNVCRLEVPR